MTQLAILFPGQGSQFVGMLAELAAQHDEVQQTFAEASTVLGYDLWQLVQQGPAEKLDTTYYTQPALLVASYAWWRVIQTKKAIKPAYLAGHSLGEYTALVCANALELTDAVKLVAARGQYMQDAVAPGLGVMAAIIGLDEASVSQLCQQAAENEVLAPANFNSLGQIVVAGHKAAVDRVLVLAKQQGAKLAVLLPVSVPSHCYLMKPAAERLALLLAETTLKKPEIPVVNNVDVVCYSSPEAIRAGLVKQLYMPVRWVETIQYLVNAGVKQLLECGPGKVLTGLNKRIDKQLRAMTAEEWLNQGADDETK